MGYIYKIENDINNKVYIGKTLLTPEVRFKEHLRDASKRTEEHRPLYAAIRKYGADHFSVEKVEECDNMSLSDRERYWISKYDSFSKGYNATLGGDGKQKFSRDKIFDELLICPYAKIVSKRVGCSLDLVRNVAHENNIKLQPENEISAKSTMSKRVSCENEFVYLIFDSIADAARWLVKVGIVKSLKSGVRSHISDCAKGKRNSAYGFIWHYI